MRVVLDVNVLISALLSGTGRPAQIIRAWQEARFELVVSPLLLDELAAALAYPKLPISEDEADAFVGLLARTATVAADADEPPPVTSRDQGDDYLLALAAANDALLVTGDRDLLALEKKAPVHTPASFLALLEPVAT